MNVIKDYALGRQSSMAEEQFISEIKLGKEHGIYWRSSINSIVWGSKIDKDRIVQLEGTYSDNALQVPEKCRPDQKLKHGIKGTIQMPLKYWQAWGIDHLPRKL